MNKIIHLAPVAMRPWRCSSCGQRHDVIYSLCPYTGIPKDRP